MSCLQLDSCYTLNHQLFGAMAAQDSFFSQHNQPRAHQFVHEVRQISTVIYTECNLALLLSLIKSFLTVRFYFYYPKEVDISTFITSLLTRSFALQYFYPIMDDYIESLGSVPVPKEGRCLPSL